MNKKKNLILRDLVSKYQANCDRINEIADVCEQEQRERNEAENAEFSALMRENQLLQMKMQAASAAQMGTAAKIDADKVLRENLLRDNKKVTIQVLREITPQTTAALADTGIIPIAEQEMLEPIRKGLIWDKVGMTIRSGLVGTLRWPKHSKAIASWADEAEEIVDSSIDFSALTMNGSRLAIAIPVTREELEDSVGIVENVINTEMPAAIIDVINAAVIGTDNTYTAADGTTKEHKQYGPFAKIVKGEAKDADGNAISVTSFAGSLPTRAELLGMVSDVTSKIDVTGACWVMTDAMATALRDVKVDEGSGRFLNEGDNILGYPIFTSSKIGEGYIGFGDWSYQAAGFFGQTTIIVDPYTLARRNSVDFVDNMRFGTATLRDEAFALGKVTTE